MCLDTSIIQNKGNDVVQIKSPATRVEITLSLLGLHNMHRALLAMDMKKASYDNGIAKRFESVKPI